MSSRKAKREKRAYSIHGITSSQFSINGVAYGSNDFMCECLSIFLNFLRDFNYDLCVVTRKESVIESAQKISPWIKQKFRKIFRKKTIVKRLPILQWMPKYNMDDFIGDLIAGVTV